MKLFLATSITLINLNLYERRVVPLTNRAGNEKERILFEATDIISDNK
jgi:hypothetical protein